MIQCNYIGKDEFSTFEKIILEKYNPGKSLLIRIKARVEASYNQYLDNFDELESKPSSDFVDDERIHLKGCYSSLTKTGIPLRALIFSEQPDVLKTLCPFCLLDKPRTLDHYMG